MCFSGSDSFLRSHLLTREPKQALSALSQRCSVFLTFPFTLGAANTRRKALQTPVYEAKAACAAASCHQTQGTWCGDASQHPLLPFPVSGSFHLMRLRGSRSLSCPAPPCRSRGLQGRVLSPPADIRHLSGKWLSPALGWKMPAPFHLAACRQFAARAAPCFFSGGYGRDVYHLRLACVEDAIRNTTRVFCLSKTFKITFFKYFSS